MKLSQTYKRLKKEASIDNATIVKITQELAIELLGRRASRREIDMDEAAFIAFQLLSGLRWMEGDIKVIEINIFTDQLFSGSQLLMGFVLSGKKELNGIVNFTSDNFIDTGKPIRSRAN